MNPTKYFSTIQENQIAKYLGWKVVSGSGARSCHPGDIISDMWLGECKTHMSPGKQISFNKTVWQKISNEATAKFKFPALFVDDGSQKIEKTWCLFPYKLVLPFHCATFKLDIKIQSNITFDHTEMSKCYADIQHRLNTDNVTISVNFADAELGVVPLNIFGSMFGEGN